MGRRAPWCRTALLLIAPLQLAQAQATDSTQTLPGRMISATRDAAVIGGAATLIARVDSLGLAPAPALDAVLRRLPFIGVRTNARGESELTIRGSESRTPTVLFDGLPVTLGWDSRADPSLIPLSGISTVRITRGMTSVLGGPNAVGGVIELDGAAPTTTHATTLATAGDHLGATTLAASVARPFSLGEDQLTVRIAATRRDRPALARARGIVDPGARRGERINSDSREADLFASARVARRSGAFLGASFAGYDAARGVQPELHLADPRLWRYPEQRRVFASLTTGTGLRRTSLGTGSLDVSVGLNDGVTAIEHFADRTYRDVTTVERGDERTVLSRAVASHSFVRGGRVRLAGSLASIRYDEQLGSAAATRYTQRLSSVGAEADVPLSDRVALAIGVAVDGAVEPDAGGREALPRREALAARVGVTYDVAAIRLHASASQRSRFPALRELYSGALARFEPNPTLRPERLGTLEGGATISRGRFALQTLGFAQRNADGIVRTTRPDRKFYRVNRDVIRSRGVEGVATWTAPSLTLLADVLVQRVRVHDLAAGATERRPEHVPEFRATVSASAPLVARVNANAWLTRTGDQFCQHPERGRQIRLAPQTRADVGLDREWPITAAVFRAVRATLAIENITNAAVFDQCGMPQPGRTVRAGLSLR